VTLREPDRTHGGGLESWVESANAPGCDFPVQNLPFGMFRRKGTKSSPRPGVAIGDRILELSALSPVRTLNELASQGPKTWRALRKALSRALTDRKQAKHLARSLVPMRSAELALPVAIGDYTDFYTSSFHATNIGRLFRPDNPLLANFKWIPIGYHGRASSVVVSGTPVVRPNGQTMAPGASAPRFGPSRRLDYEVELGFVVGPANALGKPVPISRALDHVFGVVLLNDWSARDLQAWEYQPLGPFLAKSFATTISPWIVTIDALAPFCAPAFARPQGDPRPLDYLADADNEARGHLDLRVEMYLRSARMRAQKMPPHRLSAATYASCYWTPAQIVAHHTSNGCNLQPGDLLGSGTISGPDEGSQGALIELTRGGSEPLALPGGETRTFLEDGDEVIERGWCERQGFARIGFGEASGTIRPSPAAAAA
jgi:fumarylacetoacetase